MNRFNRKCIRPKIILIYVLKYFIILILIIKVGQIMDNVCTKKVVVDWEEKNV